MAKRTPSFGNHTSSRSCRQTYTEVCPEPRLQRPSRVAVRTTRSRARCSHASPHSATSLRSMPSTVGVSSACSTRIDRVPLSKGPPAPQWVGWAAPAANDRRCSTSSCVSRPGFATTFGSLRQQKAQPASSAESARSQTSTSVASSRGTSWPALSTARKSVSLKKQFTPYFVPLRGGRPACSILLSSLPHGSALGQMTAVPRRGLKLRPSTGKNVSPPSSSSARSLR
mmetsp:Transcript_97487/g.275829  ORF Transcript_97487/g.275829 Transcript_97487/m.275829 type:complete len:227 (+) Transcript_97487:267-947(+)